MASVNPMTNTVGGTATGTTTGVAAPSYGATTTGPATGTGLATGAAPATGTAPVGTRAAVGRGVATGGASNFLLFILALLLPPVAVFLKVGLRADFWINVLLTILGWIPGILHAWWVIATTKAVVTY
ncbi:UPF0057-domain-containing protein [Daedalea quercina L-15889]|uniref:UPF0057-domain-containing protein n=1 Tax=Daedalea quercina L-15889 TaxID=1314783 RepID=A0A165MU98_9APHY|nr:UPF0057-domain-containing protein [Daedalea quercina L-15889]